MKQKHIQHLYLRAGFGIGYKELGKLKSKPKPKIVSKLFSEAETNVPIELDLSELKGLLKPYLKKEKAKDEMSKATLQQLLKKSRGKIKELNYAWIDRLTNPSSVLNEKMTLFWTNVFVCKDNNVFHIQHCYNTLLRHALGN